MGYFTDYEISEDRSGELPPVTLERLRAVLDDMDVHYTESDDEDELNLLFDNITVSIHFSGDNNTFLIFKGLWLPDLTQSDYPRALDLVNAYNSRYYHPKMFLTHSASDKVWVYAEHSIDIRFGISGPQLHGYIQSGLSCIVACLGDWGEHYPHLVREIGGGE